mgnify:CR=1 FL=1
MDAIITVDESQRKADVRTGVPEQGASRLPTVEITRPIGNPAARRRHVYADRQVLVVTRRLVELGALGLEPAAEDEGREPEPVMQRQKREGERR